MAEVAGPLMRKKILFVHQNAPGQFVHLILALSLDARYSVAVIGEKRRLVANRHKLPRNVRLHGYDMSELDERVLPIELRSTFGALRRGRAAALCFESLRRDGYIPDVIYGHPGWGDMLHARDVFPGARIVNYAEFYFNPAGQDLGFDPEFQGDPIDPLRVRTDNMPQLTSLSAADVSVAPTFWQRSRYPGCLQDHIHVVHDGISDSLRPNKNVSLAIRGGEVVLDRSTPIVTFVSRNLEPYRGFHTFMRALPSILNRIPNAQVLIVGGDEVSYSSPLPDGETYRGRMLNEIGGGIDLSRINFLGRVPYDVYVKVLQLSRAHVYLTYPFVASWSLLEAMAVGVTVIASRTAPVEEIISDGENGYLVDFFSPAQIAESVCRALVCPVTSVGDNAMETVSAKYALSKCLPRQMNILSAA